MATDRVGQQFGDYRLIRLVGQGGFADVYLGVHIRRKGLAAIKVLHTRLANDNIKSFLNEARSFRLRHAHIVQMLDFGLEDDFPFLVMDYAPNGSLRQRHPRGTQLPLDTIVSYVKQVAGALQYAHDEGVVHRDIKPDNMLLGRRNEVLLSDFGIASIAHNTPSMDVQDQAGTITYMAPEQLQGKSRPASDQYALGVVVYEWLCGDCPFHGSFAEIYSQHLSVPPPSLHERVPTLPPAVEEVVMTALAKDPRGRFANVRAFARALEQAYRPESPAHPATTLQLPATVQEDGISRKPRPSTVEAKFRPAIIEFPAAHAKNANHVPATGVVRLSLAKLATYATKDIANDGKQSKSSHRNSRPMWLFSLWIILIVILIAGFIVAASLAGILWSSAATVTITPVSKNLTNAYVISAVMGHPDPNSRQVGGARVLTYISPTRTVTTNATGTRPGTRATGQLTFLNTTTSDKTFPSLVLTGTSGVAVSFNGPVTVPTAPPSSVTVTGFAVNAGAAGNIPALDISESCCASGITVKNGAFSGGQDPQPGPAVQQSDIDGVATALVDKLIPGAREALQKQIRPNEQAVPNTFQCKKSTFTADHKAGDQASNVMVTVAITCTEGVYSQQAALSLAEKLLKTEASKDFGPNYALAGNIVTAVTRATMSDANGIISLLVRAEGVWVYRFGDAVKQALANHIASRSKQNALHYLMHQPGVSGVQIDFSSNTLPDAGHITIEIKPVPGATGTLTASSTTAPTPVPTTPITPTPGLGGS